MMMSKSRGIKALRHRGIECDERSLTLVASHRASGGFTLIELMIAIAVLLVVIAATAHIFGTASKVTGTGHAAASVLQEAAVIERMIRDDIARMSPEGFIAIRNVAVPNDVRGSGQPLLNPVLPPDAVIRADQLVFFADGIAGMHTFGIADGSANQSQGTSARVYYGHTFQLPSAPPFDAVANNDGYAYDATQDVLPWHRGNVSLARTRFVINDLAGGTTGTGVYQRSAAGAFASVPGAQPDARQWLLARQAVTLAAKDQHPPNTNAKTVYLNNRMARSIFSDQFFNGANGFSTPHQRYGWSREIRNGRMDGAASRIDDIWRYIREANVPGFFQWDWQRERHIIGRQAVYYPRAERHAPGPHRVDQALTNHVIGTAVSSFIVEWTWADGTGDMYNEEGEILCEPVGGGSFPVPCRQLLAADQWPLGFYTNCHNPGTVQPCNDFQPEQPWFGLNLPDRGVGLYGNDAFQQLANFKRASYTIWPDNVEWTGTGAQFGMPFSDSPNANLVNIYEAIFGYNRNTPSAPNPNNFWIDEPHQELAYTPWPTAIRVTMVLHDPQGRLEHGREFQFVIDLPKRVRK